MKLLLAAPFSGFPFDPIAFGAHASRLHFIMKLIFAAPTSGLPFFPTALLAHVSCPAAEPIANAITNDTYINTFILPSFLERACALMIYQNCSKLRILLDHFVGAREQRRRHGEAEDLGGLEVDDKLELSGKLNR